MGKAYRDEYNLDVRIGRIFNRYGPRLRAEISYAKVVSRFLSQALGGENLTVYGDETISWSPPVGLKEGLAKTLEWFSYGNLQMKD